ncbi:MAG: cysteine dioxygenase [Candidatus Tectimicrobiota bacterium]|nr:MAG: cysteine dioxygenase [Candidatus Tectomicrobia bacterium]
MESECACRDLASFISAMNALVAQTTDAHACVAFVQRALPSLLTQPHCLAPQHLTPAAASYARHLVYRHPQGRYVLVAMVWQPGQGTPIHDHGGVWCVEGVYRGRMQVTQYEVTPLEAGRVRVTAVRTLTAGLGNVGALIPPHEYHRMANTGDDTAVTLHVYGADLKRCRVFIERGDGTYGVQERELHYTTVAA